MLHPALVCPTCRQEWPKIMRPRVDLTDNLFVCQQGTVQLSPMEAELMYVLAVHSPAIARHDAIRSALWGLRDGPEDEANVLRTVISHVRRKIMGLGWSIEPLWREGYKLVPVG